MPSALPRRRLAARALLALPPLAGCVPYTGFAVQTVQEAEAEQAPTNLTAHTYASVDRIVAELRRLHPELLENRTPAVVGSIADIADVDRSTPLGNIIADLVRTRLVAFGVPVTDMRLRSTIKLQPRNGELTLSRDRRQVYPPPPTGMILTGTYAVGHGTVFVSLKLIRATDARILAGADFHLPRPGDVNRLLAGPVAGLR